METWMKHDLYHLNNEVLWWHDLIHDNMSSRDIRDIRDMTSRHDFISTKFYIWLLLYVAVSELKRWFYYCFTRYLCQEIHYSYRRLRDLNAWPWNRRSRHGLRDFCYLCLYSSYSDDFIRCFVRFSGHGIHSNYCQLRDLNAWPWIWRSRHGLRDFGYLWLYSSYSDDFFVVS